MCTEYFFFILHIGQYTEVSSITIGGIGSIGLIGSFVFWDDICDVFGLFVVVWFTE